MASPEVSPRQVGDTHSQVHFHVAPEIPLSTKNRPPAAPKMVQEPPLGVPDGHGGLKRGAGGPAAIGGPPAEAETIAGQVQLPAGPVAPSAYIKKKKNVS